LTSYALFSTRRSSDLSVDLFADIIFDSTLPKNILLTKIKTAWNKRLGNKRLGNKPVDQFILTMLESSVHHATRLKSADQYKNHRSEEHTSELQSRFDL